MESLLDECRLYLEGHRLEFIVIKIQIDDENGHQTQKSQYRTALNKQLKRFLPYNGITIPQLKDVKGKIYFLNQVDNSLDFGVGVEWANNLDSVQNISVLERGTTTFMAPGRVQDWYNVGLAIFGKRRKKAALFMKAFEKKLQKEFVINFASGICNFVAMNLEANPFIIQELAKMSKKYRPTKLGWSFWDFPTDAIGYRLIGGVDTHFLNVTDFIIDSNFYWGLYPDEYQIYLKIDGQWTPV